MGAFSFVLLAASLPRIVGGAPVAIGGHPEALALTVGGSDGARITCTATLVSPRAALTAAHCVVDLPAAEREGLRVFAGEGHEGGVFTGPSAAVVAVAVHPNFREHPLGQADLAVLSLDRDVTGAAPLATSLADVHRFTQADASLTLVGFGRRDDDGLGLKFAADATVLSATSAELLTAADGKDGCSGDSGGPALAGGTILGLIARGRGLTCGRGGYVTLAADQDCWIAAHTGLVANAHCRLGVPHYTPKELASLSAERLCHHANPTQRETLEALAIGLKTSTCAQTAASLGHARGLSLDFLMLRDLSPLANLPNLESLSLRGNRLQDVAALATMPRLSQVALDGNDIQDFSPALPARVHGRHRQVSTFAQTAFRSACDDGALDPAPLATVRAVKWLTQSDDCRTANQRLLALTSLTLAAQNLTDLSPLAALPTVRHLDLSGNTQLTGIAPLAEMEDLVTLDLTNTAVSDLSPLSRLVEQGLVITK